MFEWDCLIELIFILLLSFLLFLISQTRVKPIQVIIISKIIYLSSIVIWSFSCHICTVGCWPVVSHWPYQILLILKLVLGCDCKLYVDRTQTRHMDFLPPQICGRSWKGCWLSVQACLLQLIALLDIKSPSSSSFKTYFSCFWIVCIIFIGSEFIDPETCPWLCSIPRSFDITRGSSLVVNHRTADVWVTSDRPGTP